MEIPPTKRDVATSAEMQEESYESIWKIPSWKEVLKTKESVEQQKHIINAGTTKWEISLLEIVGRMVRLCWKLIDMGHETEDELKYTPKFQHFNSTELQGFITAGGGIIKINQTNKNNFPLRFPIQSSYWDTFLSSGGELSFLFNLTIKRLVTHVWDQPLHDHVPYDFPIRFSKQNKSNLALLLNDSSSSDLKIITKDNKELTAHKIILKAQCPVFESMFSSQFAEGTTGVVNVRDISGKIMGILLHFFYTGELLPSWSDEDTIVEFTYAAGKYQMTEVLELLDRVLGTTDDKETSDFDLYLMSMAHKLSLKNAETRLFERVKKMSDPAQFLALFDAGRNEDSSEGCELLVRADQD